MKRSVEEKRLILKQLATNIIFYICNKYGFSGLAQYAVSLVLRGIDSLEDSEVNYIYQQIHRFIASKS